MQRQILTVSRSALRTAFLTSQSRVIVSERPQFIKSYRSFSNTTRLLNEKKPEESNTEAESSLTPEQQELADLKAKLEAKDKEAAEFKDRYVRSVADFRNLQETTKREIQKSKDFALQKFAKDLIESIDNFGHALSSVKEDTLKSNAEVAQLYDGVKMTRDIFEKTLSRHGLVKIEPLDEPFDPNQHEATFQSPQPGKEPGTVFFVQQPGFTLNGRVLRPAKVGIVKSDD